MSITVALAGDTMLGRSVAERLRSNRPQALFAAELIEAVGAADLFLLNLECCIAEGGSPWADPGKPFFFRAPPVAAELLAELGVDCATLANNHALDFGREALLETIERLRAAGVAPVGAGEDVEAARAPPRRGWVPPRRGRVFRPPGRVRRRMLARPPRRSSRPAPPSSPGTQPTSSRASKGLSSTTSATSSTTTPSMTSCATTSGSSSSSRSTPPAAQDRALPLALDYCLTRLADPPESEWIARRLQQACAPFGTSVEVADGQLLLAGRQPPFSDP